MAVTGAELAMLTTLVGRFENGGKDAYAGVSGDFDGMGISCGVLQWNIGQGSLQPLVTKTGRPNVLLTMPTLGPAMWQACTGSIASGLAVVRSWQNGSKLSAIARAELAALMGSAPMRAAQDEKIMAVANTADGWAAQWAAARGTGVRTTQELAWFFDIATQNGNMKGMGFAEVSALKQHATPDRVDDLICDWLLSLGSGFAGIADCHKNAGLWRNSVSGAALDLLVLAYLRSQKSTLRWRGDVMNRKGTLAVRKGFVHTELYTLTDLF
jgi:hypothetical protein